MNYLEIARRVNDTTGFQGQINTVVASGYQATLTSAIKDTFEDIQRYRPDWNWMKKYRQVNVSNLASSYTLEELWAGDEVDLAEWLYLNYDYKRLRQIHPEDYELIDFTAASYREPKLYTIDPATKDLRISPVDQVYTLDLHYIRTLQELVNNTDTPILPARHHALIVYGAITKLSTFIGNGTLYDTYSMKYAEGMGQLMREENPAKVIRKRPIA